MRYADWMALAAAEYARLSDLLDGLDADDWHRPTDCAGWDVHDVVAHLVGAAESTASVRELLRQRRLGRVLQPGGTDVDAMNALQVRERRGVPPSELREALRAAAGRGLRARRRLPPPLRALPLSLGPPLGRRRLGYLMGCIYTRDAWLHRIDVCRATDREPGLTAGHDGVVVADVVREWASVHADAYDLELSGPAGGRWSRGHGERIRMDAVQFCRVLSGRAPGSGLLAVAVPF